MKKVARFIIAILGVMLIFGMLPAIPEIFQAEHVNAGIWVQLAIKAAVVYGLWRLYSFLEDTSNLEEPTLYGHYKTLGVRPDAPEVVIKAAYKVLSQTHHPDRGGNAERMAAINAAYEAIADPEKRREYDATIKHLAEKGDINHTVRAVVISLCALVLGVGVFKFVDSRVQESVQGDVSANIVRNPPTNIMTWLWSPARSNGPVDVIDSVFLNSIEGIRDVKITNKSGYEIKRVTLGLAFDDSCPNQKSHYREFISCDVKLSSNSTKIANCESDLPTDAPLCLVGVTYLLPFSGTLTPVSPLTN